MRRRPATRRSGASRAASRLCGPSSWPKIWTVGELAPVWIAQIEKSSSGACGAKACQARTTSASCDQGQSAKKNDTSATGWVWSSKCVTTPKLPPAAAAAGPVEVGVLGRAAGAVAAVGGDDPERDDVVGGRAELPRGEADAAAECETADPDGRARSGRDPAAAGRQSCLDVDQACAGADRRDARRAERDRAQPAEVADDAARRRVAGVAVPARADRERDLCPSRPGDHLADVVNRQRLHDPERPDAVVALVVDEPRLGVGRARAPDHGPGDAGCERLQASAGRAGEHAPGQGEGGSRGDPPEQERPAVEPHAATSSSSSVRPRHS